MRILIFCCTLFCFNAQAMDASLMVDIIECESGGKYNAVGDDASGPGGLSVGIAQFQKDTFNEMKVLAKMPRLRWKRPIDQLRLMIWMVDNGYAKRWTCYRTLASKKR